MTLDELKRLRERLGDPSYAVVGLGDIVDACRASIDDLIERKTRGAWIPPTLRWQHGASAVKGREDGTYTVGVEKTNQGGGGDVVASASEAAPSSSAPRMPASDTSRTDSAAAASFEERINALIAGVYRPDSVSHRCAREQLAARCLRAEDSIAAKDAEIARLTKERDSAYTEIKRCITDRDALKAALDEERKACDEWRGCAPKDVQLDHDATVPSWRPCIHGLAVCAVKHDARRASKQESDHA